MLGPVSVVHAVVYVDLLELIAIGERAIGYVDRFRLFVHFEDQKLSGVVEMAGYLRTTKTTVAG